MWMPSLWKSAARLQAGSKTLHLQLRVTLSPSTTGRTGLSNITEPAGQQGGEHTEGLYVPLKIKIKISPFVQLSYHGQCHKLDFRLGNGAEY